MTRKKPKIPQLYQLPQTQKSDNWFDRIASPYLQEYEKLNEEDKNKLLSYSNQTTKRNTGIGSFDPQAINSINSLVKGLLGVEPTTGRNSGGGSFDPETVKTQNAQNSWFKAGGLSDGYDFGDLTASNWASTGDFLRHVGKGAFGVAEGVVDTVLYGMSEASGLAGDAASYFGLGKVEDVARFTDQKMKELAMEDSATAAFGGTGDWLDEMSYLGGKTDSVAEGVGQVATTALLAKFGGANGVNPTLLTSGTMFASSLGRGITEALNSGASDEEAWLYGLISGTADAATEMLFGGIGKGINALGFSRGITSLDDIVAKNITGKISNTLMKNIAQAGIKGGFEGLEEVLAGFAQAWGKSVTYLKDEVDSGKLDFWDIVKDENLFEQWITGALTSAISSAPSVTQATVKGQDYITGYTKNDQAVIDRVIQDRIAEAEAAGQKLTAKDKANIKAEVEEDLEKGHISLDTIEETLGGDKYTAYQDTIQQENNALAELAELYEGDELQQKAEEFMANSKRGEAAQALRDSVFDLVKDSRLGESYREVGRRSQKFEVDLNQYTDEKQRAIVQKAVESGVLNNTNRTHDMVNWVSSMAAKMDTNFDFTNNEKLKDSIFAVDGKTVDGYVTKDGIVINVNSPKYINTVVGHEITHVLEGSNLYDALESTMIEYAKEKGTYQDVMKAAYEMYHNVEGYQGTDGLKKIKKEAVANMVGDYLFTDKNFINHLAKNQNVFQKVWNEVKYMVKIARAGSNEHKKLLEVQRAFEKAYQEAAQNTGKQSQEQKNTAEDGGVQYSLQYLSAETNTEILEMITHVIDGDFSGNSKVYLGIVPDSVAKSIFEITGINVRGFDMAIEARMVEHILKGHGKNGDADQSMQDPNHLARIQYVLFQADDIRDAGRTSAYTHFKNGKSRPAPTVLYEKSIGEKSYYVVQAVPDTKAKTLYVVSAFIGPEGYKKEASQLINAKGPDATANTDSVVASKNSIPNPEADVKEKLSHYSLSDDNTLTEKYGNYRVSGEEIALKDDLLPMGEMVLAIDALERLETAQADPNVTDEELDALVDEALPMAEQLKQRLLDAQKARRAKTLETNTVLRDRQLADLDRQIAEKEAQLEVMEHPYSNAAKELRRQIEQLKQKRSVTERNFENVVRALEAKAETEAMETEAAEEVAEEVVAPERENQQDDPLANLRLQREEVQKDLDNYRNLIEQTVAVVEAEIGTLKRQLTSLAGKNSREAIALQEKILEKERYRQNVVDGLQQTVTALEEKAAKLNSANRERAEVRNFKAKQLTDYWKNLIGSTMFWKDLPTGLSYKTQTLRRILRDVVRGADGKPNYQLADQIYNALETTYDQNEASLKISSRNYKKPFADLKLNNEEDQYAHMLGELQYNPETELSADEVSEFYEKHKNKIDTDKVQTAIEEARRVFDDLFVRVNAVLKANGMTEIAYREGYFPHFTNPKQNKFMKALGWKPINAEIPTSIAGLTETFKPNKSYQSFDKTRKSDQTDYSLLQGLDMYIHGALDWIYHTEDIQRFRSLENWIRAEHADNNQRERIQAIIADDTLDAEQMQDQIAAALENKEMKLGGLVRELRNRANNLANKKAAGDRKMEEDTNRKMYSVMTNVNSRVNANMVVGSLRSAMTNFIPLVQSWHEVNPVYTALGMMETVKGKLVGDDIIEKSTFLTNRLMDEENLYKTGWDKVTDVVSWFGNRVDSITAQTVWRSKYLQNLKSGMSEDAAIADADQFAKNLMAGRSRGNAPTIFNEKNPITKLFTAFQLEVANQYGYMFKDVIQDAKIKASQTDGKAQKAKIYGKLVSGYAEAFIGAYLFNSLFSMITGSTTAFDPIRIIQELLGDMGVGDDDEEPEEWDQILLKFGENVLQEVPFIGGLLGGGRTPISNILPYGSKDNPLSTMLKDVKKGNFELAVEEWLNPLWYLALPVGGGQLKKTWQGLRMFDDDLPISGSYTDSGNLRYPVEENFWNVAQAGLFGQYANSNARDYFDQGRSALNPNQQREFASLGVDIQDYWDFQDREKKIADMVEAGNAPDMVIIMNKYLNSVRSEMNELLKEEEDLLSDSTLNAFAKNKRLQEIRAEYDALAKARYNDYGNVTFDGNYASVGGAYYKWYTPKNGEPEWRKMSDEQVDAYLTTKDAGNAYYATNGKTHYRRNEDDEWEKITEDQLAKQNKVTHKLGISAEDYWSRKEEYDFAYEYPERYSIAKTVGGYENYKTYSDILNGIKSDYDASGKPIRGSREAKVRNYIWDLDIPEEQKMILFKSQYTADDTYNVKIINYLNGRRDLTRDEKIMILKKLGFDVDKNGKISW